MVVALERRSRPQKAVIRLLQQIIRESIVSGRARQIHPDWACGLLVEDAKRFFSHLERPLGFLESSCAFHVRECELTHTVPHASVLFGRCTRPSRTDTTYASTADA